MFGLSTTRRARAAELRARRAASDADRRDLLLVRLHRQIAADENRIRHLTAQLDTNRELLVNALSDAGSSQRALRLLAEQLLDATSGQSTSAREILGLTVSPWDRAVDGLNALVDAGIGFHVEPDGHISNPSGDEHIEWDDKAQRWRLVHDDEADDRG